MLFLRGTRTWHTAMLPALASTRHTKRQEGCLWALSEQCSSPRLMAANQITRLLCQDTAGQLMTMQVSKKLPHGHAGL